MDAGRGIPADKLEAIFGRFQQVDASDSRQKGGTDLGLAICRTIVQHHSEMCIRDSGVAILPPVNPRGGYTQLQVDIGFAHTGFAALMFLALAYFCLFLFRRTSPEKRLTRRKRHRNNLYAICGFTIVISMMGMVCLLYTSRCV